MSEACLKQIMYWNKALQQSQKGHKRKNRLVARLRDQVSDLEAENRRMMLRLAKLELMVDQQDEG